MSFYKNVVNSMVQDFIRNVCKSLKDKNTIPVNVGDPPNKTYTSYPVHKMVYIKAIISKCKKGEISPDKSVKITYLNRYANVFGISPLYSLQQIFRYGYCNAINAFERRF